MKDRAGPSRRHPRAGDDPEHQERRPGDKSSPEVIQIETAMGAAIEIFDDATTIEVTRDRFVPVKTTNDLLVLRSDCYELTDDYVLRLVADTVPFVDLDPSHYKLISGFDAALSRRGAVACGRPAARRARRLDVRRRRESWSATQSSTIRRTAARWTPARPSGESAPEPRHYCAGYGFCVDADRPAELGRRARGADRRVDHAAPALRPAAPRGDGSPRLRGHHRADGPAVLRQLGDGRLCRLLRRRVERERGPPGPPARRRRDGRRADQAVRPLARHRRPDHDGSTGAAGGRLRRTRGVDGRWCRDGADHPRRRPSASTCATAARTSDAATCCSRTVPSSGPASWACSPRSAARRCRRGRDPVW